LLTTERLILRRPTPDDVEAAAALLRDPEVMAWLGGVVDDPQPVLERWLDDWETYPAGKFFVERHDGAFVGRVGLNYFDPVTWARSTADHAQPELGWAVTSEHWGRGYATEAATAVREWAGVPRLVSVIEPSNVRSIRVAEKLDCVRTDEVAVIGGVACEVWLHPPESRPSV
jgi:RimJ/RimL family protein N-acetyltransferase